MTILITSDSEVDNDGLVNVAKACLEYKVPSLVIVSSGGVSKPDSPVYKFLNIFGKIMEEKIKGLYEQLGLSREAQELPPEGED